MHEIEQRLSSYQVHFFTEGSELGSRFAFIFGINKRKHGDIVGPAKPLDRIVHPLRSTMSAESRDVGANEQDPPSSLFWVRGLSKRHVLIS
jgi:hypothetical protein